MRQIVRLVFRASSKLYMESYTEGVVCRLHGQFQDNNGRARAAQGTPYYPLGVEVELACKPGFEPTGDSCIQLVWCIMR